ncbi:hypothetical protein GPECTOR_25g329 [Gonium pectorale]|uniref:Protein-S-isoprenylcysteine O-methyltransferase n=1 Tax=Gonium pectorale TaxID=33097 RepID=A0A150GGK4_GONPE|nr:hypothetical protein GPECTOR_25g329 [Gonium pectorale]|eukprot:KXZ48745.1 hypothetical protein GPECTOR_25g329 [Gonium pectorale]
MSFAVLEYGLESWLLPGMKTDNGRLGYISWIGLAMIVLGEGLRKVGMVTARSNFTHHIRTQKRETHQLVCWGIYRYVRHPGYLGWYIWCVGTQVLLVNPVCSVGFAVVTWRFFRDRLHVEEYYLRRFFGAEYEAYAARTPTWIPLIP